VPLDHHRRAEGGPAPEYETKQYPRYLIRRPDQFGLDAAGIGIMATRRRTPQEHAPHCRGKSGEFVHVKFSRGAVARNARSFFIAGHLASPVTRACQHSVELPADRRTTK
jgi:hypothetical protein